MRTSEKIFKPATVLAGILAIASSLLMIVFIILAELGCITPRQIPLVIKTETVSKEYDGNPITGDLEIVYGYLAAGHSITVLSQSSLSEMGSIENKAEIMISDSTGADVTKLYQLKLEYGTLTMKPRKINLITGSASKIYDGTPLSSANVSDPNGKLVRGDTIKIIGAPELTEAKTVENKVLYCIVNAKGEDVTDLYDITETYGNLTVNQRNLTVTTGSAEKLYDGKELTCETYSLTEGNLISGHSVKIIKATGLATAGTVENELGFAVYDKSGADVSAFYNITQKKGKLTVIGKNLVIATGSADKVYDGIPLSREDWTLQSGTLSAGHKIKLAENTKFDGVGSVDNVVRVMVVDSAGNDVTNHYSISYSYGVLSVTPARLTVRTDSVYKQYDGKAIECNTYEIRDGSLCAGHKLTIVCKSRTNRGSFANDIVSYKITETKSDGSVKDVTNCYQIVFESGTIRIY